MQETAETVLEEIVEDGGNFGLFLKSKWALLAHDYSLVGLDLESFKLLGLLGLS